MAKLPALLSAAKANPFGFTVAFSTETEDVTVYPLKEYLRVCEEHKASGVCTDVLIGFCDAADGEYPCWTLRNLLVMAAHQFKVHKLKVLCFRERGVEGKPYPNLFTNKPFPQQHTTIERSKSIILDVSLPAADSLALNPIGWETDPRCPTKTKTKCTKLSEQMDPVACDFR